MKISNEERARIFHAYNGAQCELEGGNEGVIIGSLSGVHFYDVSVSPNYGNESNIWGNATDCQLLLTPLSEITDEHATEICGLLNLQYSNTNEDYFFDLAGLASWLTEMFDGENQFRDTFGFDRAVKAIDYLRSVGYNVGYGSYSPQDLIDNGIVKG